MGGARVKKKKTRCGGRASVDVVEQAKLPGHKKAKKRGAGAGRGAVKGGRGGGKKKKRKDELR